LSQIFSIILYIILLFCLFKFSEDFLKKQNPKLNFKEKLFNHDTKIYFTDILESILYNFDITLYTNNSNENLTEAIKTYFKIYFDIGNYEFDENINFYYDDFQITQIINLTNNNSKNNLDQTYSENVTNNNSYIFKFNISFNALIDKNTIFKFYSMPINISNSAIIPDYLNIRNYSLIDKDDFNNFFIKFEDVIINVNTDFVFYSTYNEIKTSGMEINLNSKLGKFCTYDSIIDPDIPEYAKIVFDKYRFSRQGYLYNYQLIELIEDTDWIFTNFQTKYIMQIDNWSVLELLESERSILDKFWFNISRKMKSETRIYKKFQIS